MAGSMQAAEAAGRISALLSLLALRRLIALLQPLALLLLLPFRWRGARPGAAAAAAAAAADAVAASVASGGKKGKAAVVLRVPAGSPIVAARRQASARREIAARRAREAGREYELIPTHRGETLFTQCWWPHGSSSAIKPRALVVVMHGLNEHSGRYDHLARRLNDIGVKVYGMDWTGHGGSDGLHGYVQSLDHAVSDLAMLDPEVDSCVEGIFLTSPAVRVQPAHPIIKVMAPVFALIAPRYQFTASHRNGPPVSRDPEALKAKYSDQLVFTGSIRVRTGYEILRLTSYLQQHLHRITVPMLVMHGADDMVTDPQGSQKLYEEASSSDKSLNLYNGLLHDLLIEPEKEKIMDNIDEHPGLPMVMTRSLIICRAEEGERCCKPAMLLASRRW
uniref:OAJNBa0031O09.10 n=1 Tax=Oryza sativa subsp. japonica TaxID=39947 RepID=Q8LLN8_ORYSJ|nr:OAJNBa0031O09.10 [Oryza sativa Japonica Group]